MMKKILMGAGLVVVGAAVLMPYVTGYVAQDSIQKLAAQINDKRDLHGSVEVVSYQRGYLNSQASYSWELPAPYAQEFGVIEYSCEGKHGLFSYNYQCHIDKLDAYNAFVTEYLSGNDPFHMEGYVSVFGNVYSKLVLDSFAFSKDDISVEFKPAYFGVKSDLSLLPYVAAAEAGGITVVNTANETTMTMGRSVLNVDGVMKYDTLMVGDIGMVVDDVSVQGSARYLNMNKLALTFDTKEADDDRLSIDYIIGVDSFMSSDSLTGKTFEAENGNMSLMVDGLNAEKFSVLIHQLNELSQLNSSGEITADQQQATMIALLPTVEALLRDGLQLTLGVGAELDKQASRLDAHIRLIDQATLAEISSLLFNHELLLDKAEVNIDAVVAESALAEIGPVQAMVVNHPAVQKIGTAYESHIQLKKGDVQLNGRVLTLQELIATLSGR